MKLNLINVCINDQYLFRYGRTHLYNSVQIASVMVCLAMRESGPKRRQSGGLTESEPKTRGKQGTEINKEKP